MKNKILFALIIISIIFTNSCNKSLELNIPLLVVGNDNSLKLAKWDTRQNNIEISNEKILTLESFTSNIFWDGENRFILLGDVKEIYKEGIMIDKYRYASNSILYYKDTMLENIDEKTYRLTKDGKYYTFDLEKAVEESNQANVDLDDCAISSYIVNGDNIYLLLNRFSNKINSIELIVSKINYKTGDIEISHINNNPGYSPANPPIAYNILQKENGFIAFNDDVVTFIDLEKLESKEIITNEELPKITDSGKPNLYKIGFYKDYLLIMAYQYYKTSDKAYYKLYVLNNSNVFSSIDVDMEKEVCLPNFK